MGGCRCTFRDCTNSTANSPGTHFFHFPFRDWERCEKWAKYSGNMHFLTLEVSKLRNKVVCEKHFHDEYFMNYKKERLIQNAVPTLIRLGNNHVLDFSESDNPQPKYLEPSNLQHLIPPQTEKSYIEQVSKLNTVQDSPPPAKKPNLQQPRILNVAAPQNLISMKAPANLTMIPTQPEFSIESVSEADVTEIDFGPAMSLAEESVEDSELETEKISLKPDHEKELEFLQEIDSLKVELDEKTKEMHQMEKAMIKMQEQIAAYEAKATKQVTQVETITTSKKLESSGGVSTPLNKSQLFNGIKKYLSPSMATMVRMEMFGGPEREWKQDEKNIAVELLSLGEHVFEYVRDEWRCRLPPKRDVEEWLGNRGQFQEDEDL